MNEKLEKFARQSLKDGLSILSAPQLRTFKLMYGRLGGKRSVEDAVAMSIDEIVSEVPACELDWAMRQVDGSLMRKSQGGQS